MTLTMPAEMVAELRKITLSDTRKEVCGVVTARDGEWGRVIQVPNVAMRGDVRFQFHPMDQLRIWQEVEDAGEVIIGIYHSHLITEAVPSPIDVMYAQPKIFQVIISAKDLHIRVFMVYPRGAQKCVKEIPLEVGSGNVRDAMILYGMTSPTTNESQEITYGM